MSQKLEALFQPVEDLGQAQKDQMELVRSRALELSKAIYPADSPEKTLALRKLQECVFWTNYAITHS